MNLEHGKESRRYSPGVAGRALRVALSALTLLSAAPASAQDREGVSRASVASVSPSEEQLRERAIEATAHGVVEKLRSVEFLAAVHQDPQEAFRLTLGSHRLTRESLRDTKYDLERLANTYAYMMVFFKEGGKAVVRLIPPGEKHTARRVHAAAHPEILGYGNVFFISPTTYVTAGHVASSGDADRESWRKLPLDIAVGEVPKHMAVPVGHIVPFDAAITDAEVEGKIGVLTGADADTSDETDAHGMKALPGVPVSARPFVDNGWLLKGGERARAYAGRRSFIFPIPMEQVFPRAVVGPATSEGAEHTPVKGMSGSMLLTFKSGRWVLSGLFDSFTTRVFVGERGVESYGIALVQGIDAIKEALKNPRYDRTGTIEFVK